MNRRNEYRAVLLDLGNVVLDWDVEHILVSLNLAEDQRNLLRSELFFHQDWLDMDHGKESETSVLSKVCERSSLSRNTVERALLAAKKSLSPISETLLLMREITSGGTKMYCLSNMSCETYDHIKNLELFNMFSGIVISGIEGCMKPNDDIFHLTLNRFGLEATDTLFVDDSLANIKTAQRLGIGAYHFKRSKNCYSEIRSLLRK